jgi:hypothetical protein
MLLKVTELHVLGLIVIIKMDVMLSDVNGNLC